MILRLMKIYLLRKINLKENRIFEINKKTITHQLNFYEYKIKF